ncbi:TraR/DksA family transcriptional regulator [Shewanella gaetbuli]|uniref:TraR/DksA C4-type zinc finger protein n=1 Tax=Shewanella gaetbuli TaxID=220752 RepID=A0A9X1ZLX7_9GAMM|nr:TraR/DksA C4-type zinc finger protein [Shewanella gaetbuli]
MVDQHINLQLAHIGMQLRSEIAILLTQQNMPLNDVDQLNGQDLSTLIDFLSLHKLTDEPVFERLMRLDAAICQLELGLYGLCSDCESEIEQSRLQSDPTEQRCEDCAKRHSQEHRQELRLNY